MFFSQASSGNNGPGTGSNSGGNTNVGSGTGSGGMPQPANVTGESYTVSQSQTINFTQQTLRQRQQQQQQQQHHAAAGHPGMSQGTGWKNKSFLVSILLNNS